MLNQFQIQSAIRAGSEDATTACRESGMYDPPADGWDGWLVNSIGGDEVAEIAGLKRQTGPDWEMWLSIYHAAACVIATDARTYQDKIVSK